MCSNLISGQMIDLSVFGETEIKSLCKRFQLNIGKIKTALGILVDNSKSFSTAI